MPQSSDELDLTIGDEAQVDRASALYALAQATVGEYSARDAMLENLEPYYFLKGEKDPDQDSDDETLEIVRLPHGTDLVDLIQSLLSNTELQISVPARSSLKRDLNLADNTEAFLRAWLAESEKAAGQGLLDRGAWLVCMRAAFCARIVFLPGRLEMDESTGTYKQGRRFPVQAQVRDPLVVYPQFGEDGLLYVVEQWTRTVADVRYTWGENLLPDKEDPSEEVTWTELWTTSEFCYWADGQLVPREIDGASTVGPWEHDYGDIPYVVRFAHQTGLREPERRARPLLESQRGVIDGMDKLDTVELTTVSEYGGDALVVKTRNDRDFTVDLGALAINYLQPDESIDWLRAGRQPFDARGARGKYEQAFQRGTIPYSMYGQDPGRMMSGYSLSLLNQGGQIRIQAIIEALEEGMAELLSKALMVIETQMAEIMDGGIVKAYTRDTHTTDKGRSRTVRQEIALPAGDLDGYYEVDVSLGETMPQDWQSNVVMALRTQQPGANGRPLMSWQTAVEKFKLVESPAEERRRIDEEMVANDPEVAELRRAILAAKVKEELADDAQELGVDVEEVLARARAQAEARAATPPPGPEMAAGLPSAMMPPQMQGMPPELMGPGMPGVI